jgi:hypothetical protein
MKKFAGRDGVKRLWFEPSEIEEIMEHELAKGKLMPTVADCSVDVELFLERHLKVQCDQYAPLPPEILGLTQFRPGQKPWVRINQDLTQTALDDEDRPDWMVGRWRATLAHEASHVILHACLFATNPNQATLFALDDGEPEEHNLHRCLKQNVLFRGMASDWREVQANMGMAALLMPRKIFSAACVQVINDLGWNQDVQSGSLQHRTLTRSLAERFQVSRQAADIRLETLQLLTQQGRHKLF